MTTAAESPARFALDQTKAAEFIAQAIARYEDGAQPDDTLPDIGTSYRPRDYDEHGETFSLVAAARDLGAITGPGSVDFDFCGGDGDVGYTWVTWTGSLKLASFYEELSHLGDADAEGAEAAMSVLREAVESANSLLDDLDRYVASLPLAVRAPEVPDLVDQIMAIRQVGTKGYGELSAVLGKWFAAHGIDVLG